MTRLPIEVIDLSDDDEPIITQSNGSYIDLRSEENEIGRESEERSRNPEVVLKSNSSPVHITVNSFEDGTAILSSQDEQQFKSKSGLSDKDEQQSKSKPFSFRREQQSKSKPFNFQDEQQSKSKSIFSSQDGQQFKYKSLLSSQDEQQFKSKSGLSDKDEQQVKSKPFSFQDEQQSKSKSILRSPDEQQSKSKPFSFQDDQQSKSKSILRDQQYKSRPILSSQDGRQVKYKSLLSSQDEEQFKSKPFNFQDEQQVKYKSLLSFQDEQQYKSKPFSFQDEQQSKLKPIFSSQDEQQFKSRPFSFQDEQQSKSKSILRSPDEQQAKYKSLFSSQDEQQPKYKSLFSSQDDQQSKSKPFSSQDEQSKSRLSARGSPRSQQTQQPGHNSATSNERNHLFVDQDSTRLFVDQDSTRDESVVISSSQFEDRIGDISYRKSLDHKPKPTHRETVNILDERETVSGSRIEIILDEPETAPTGQNILDQNILDDRETVPTRRTQNLLDEFVDWLSDSDEDDSFNRPPKKARIITKQPPVAATIDQASRNRPSSNSINTSNITESSLIRPSSGIANVEGNHKKQRTSLGDIQSKARATRKIIPLSSDDLVESSQHDAVFPRSSPERMAAPTTVSQQIQQPKKTAEIYNVRQSVCPITLSDPITSDSSPPQSPTSGRSAAMQTDKSPATAKPGTAKRKGKAPGSTKALARSAILGTNQTYSLKEFSKVNKVTHSKEELMKEMIITIPFSLYESIFNKEHMKEIFTLTEVRKTYDVCPLISWKRRVEADYDSARDYFIPCPTKEVSESTAVLYYKAEELITKIRKRTFEQDVIQLQNKMRRQRMSEKSSVPTTMVKDVHVIVVIEGYEQYLMKLRNYHDRVYKKAVLSKLGDIAASSAATKKTKSSGVDESLTVSDVELMVNQLQVDYRVNVFPVRTNHEAIAWLHSFTYTIAYALYDKYQRNESLANIGRVKSGHDARSTFVEAIRQFNLMTTPRAEQVYEFYGSFASLYGRYMQHTSLGTVGNKNVVPPSTDAAMRKFFTSEDANDKVNG